MSSRTGRHTQRLPSLVDVLRQTTCREELVLGRNALESEIQPCFLYQPSVLISVARCMEDGEGEVSVLRAYPFRITYVLVLAQPFIHRCKADSTCIVHTDHEDTGSSESSSSSRVRILCEALARGSSSCTALSDRRKRHPRSI